MVSCTYPAPFHAHTHFLATVCGILILDAAPQAPTSLCTIALLQDLHHLCLVDWVNALQVERDKEASRFALLYSFPLAICCAITVLGPVPSLGHCPISSTRRMEPNAILHLAVPIWVPSSVSPSPNHKSPWGTRACYPKADSFFSPHFGV